MSGRIVPGNIAAPTPGVEQVLAETQEFLRYVERLVLALQDDPDDATIGAALEALEAIRDSVELGEMIQRIAVTLRNTLMAVLSNEAPALTLGTVGAAAGCGDSYVSRVAKQYGMARRPRDAQGAEQDTGRRISGGDRKGAAAN